MRAVLPSIDQLGSDIGLGQHHINRLSKRFSIAGRHQ
jgi:hypothetical protein